MPLLHTCTQLHMCMADTCHGYIHVHMCMVYTHGYTHTHLYIAYIFVHSIFVHACTMVICMYTAAHICMAAHVHAAVYMCHAYTCVDGAHTWLHTHTPVYSYIHVPWLHISTCVCATVYTWLHACDNVLVTGVYYTCTYTYICVCIVSGHTHACLYGDMHICVQ